MIDQLPAVLVLEDDPADRNAVAEGLTDEFRVWPAADVAEALATCSAVSPQVLVVDIGLPGPSGREFIERYRAGGGTGRIVLFTGRPDAFAMARALEVDGVVPKPYDLDDLITTVRLLAGMEKRRADQQLY